jgi:hypothetical protein
MPASLRQIGWSMDRMYPPSVPQPPPMRSALSMRKLAARFRYKGLTPGETPKPVISLRLMAGRVGDSATRLEFLHYNTWLMRDTFQVADLVKAAGELPQFVACVGLRSADILAFLLNKYGTSGVCDAVFPPGFSACGVSTNPFNDACKLLGGKVDDIAEYVINHAGFGVDQIFNLFSVPFNVAVDILFEMLGVVVPVEIYTVEKPELEARLNEIGDQVFRYDLAALCEVWRPEDKDKLLSRGQVASPPLRGPDEPGLGDWRHLGSGLLVFSPTFGISDGGAYTYKRAGVTRKSAGGCDFGRAVDSDLWATKGVQRTLIDVGTGFVELYSTHLYSGVEMPEWLTATAASLVDPPYHPQDSEKSEIRAAQLMELAQYVADTHVASNVAMITGDFNIPAGEMASLINSLNANSGLLFDDWYDLPMFSEIYPREPPSGPGPDPEAGHTNRGEDTPTFDTICKVFPQDPQDTPVLPPFGSPVVAPGDYFCDEKIAPDPNPTGQRFDYILVQRPILGHPFNLDVSRIRRRAFKRFGKNEPQYFMSDHLGLEVSLFASSGP